MSDSLVSFGPASHGRAPSRNLAALTLGAIGVVYGDIGTSPLYTIKEVFSPATGLALTPANLIGALSVVFWSLMLVVTLKYVILILRADNDGEGGILALTTLAARSARNLPRRRSLLLLLGISGATLFYGDSVITPAISVLGAMEGLELLAPSLEPYVVYISLAILLGLFVIQRLGTHVVGKWFGPIIVLWFTTLGITGLYQILQQPAILAALNPRHALTFLDSHGWHILAITGAIVLALTGAEALYADMGHFGRRPIRLAWTGLVLPGLTLNYLGQGALLMARPEAIENPFYRLFPEPLLVPALILASLAAIIASQAVISGAYSMTKQAIQLGFLPRMEIRYTSAREAGQIYMPSVNWALLAGVIAAVLIFSSASALAGAYGIAVTLTMLITTLLTYVVTRSCWRIPRLIALPVTLFFLLIDLVLVTSCALKFLEGGWFPLVMAALLFLVMTTWARGRRLLADTVRKEGIDLQDFIDSLSPQGLQRCQRTAVYCVANPDTVPQALLHNLRHNEVLHQHNIILTLVFHEIPWVGMDKRVEIRPLGHGFWRVTLHFGYMNTPNVPAALSLAESRGLRIPAFETTYFLSRENVVAGGHGPASWRKQLFAVMSRNAGHIAEYFCLPDNSVIELGTRVQI